MQARSHAAGIRNWTIDRSLIIEIAVQACGNPRRVASRLTLRKHPSLRLSTGVGPHAGSMSQQQLTRHNLQHKDDLGFHTVAHFVIKAEASSLHRQPIV